MTAPLAGIRVVELASFVAAPAGGALLVDLGAEVIKVEVPWGEIYRHSTARMMGIARVVLARRLRASSWSVVLARRRRELSYWAARTCCSALPAVPPWLRSQSTM